MAFKEKPVQFTLKDIGSQVIDQISSDIYAGPGSILREIVKNAYDSYLKIDPDELAEEGIERAVHVTRYGDDGGTRRLLIADNGTGQSFKQIRANVQISISTKPEDLPDATGFRGLGSWAILGAGSKLIITSKVKGEATRSRLTISVREIYGRMSSKTTLDDILNDRKCISFAEEDSASKDEHGTIVEIVCDGPTELVNGYELNRLYDFTDPEKGHKLLRDLLVRYCAIPYRFEGGSYPLIQEQYRRSHYIPTAIYLDNDKLERSLPPELTDFQPIQISMNDTIVACGWYAENAKKTGQLTIDEDVHLIDGPGIQVVKLNVPVGPKNLKFDCPRPDLMDWYVGEVHILADDIKPNASGDDLRSGLAREGFLVQLNRFYKTLVQAANVKSERISLQKNLEKGIKAAETAKAPGGAKKGPQAAQVTKDILKALDALKTTDIKGNPKSDQAVRIREAMSSEEMKSLRSKARKLLKEGGWLEQYGSETNGTQKSARATKPKAAAVVGRSRNSKLQAGVQSKLARCIPELEALDLTAEQIDGVLKIMESLLTAEEQLQ